ncbi:glycosyltransferase family 2 protein [Paenibacillus mesophilus]|uniref:glycosyltransferase family 2 protein n=1 Tax=Paenibacillus mesophilus TaxID=2582849 RepID=UPI00110EB54C|nr:glycosyltransferase family 2 protein [Paenibacillus mesophilus]TMV52207.1 glycosyltransferase family 2 protein [Paenibacillus mesophilus]
MARSGVTIITCTKRAAYLDNIFNNYKNQQGINKELIIVLNHDKLVPEHYRRKANAYGSVSVYRLPEKMSLGSCLNFAVNKARYPVIAKFDDDDYYAPRYLSDSIAALAKSKADIVGKRSYYMYLEGKKVLILRFPKGANKFVRTVAGATLVIRKRVFRKVRFGNRTLGEDVKFCRDSRARGFKIYSGSSRSFVAVRRKRSLNHTWIVSDRKLLSNKQVRIIGRVTYYRNFAALTKK